MSGFIGHLLARARGEAATVQPRQRARFEPDVLDDQGFGITEFHEERVIEAPPSSLEKPDTDHAVVVRARRDIPASAGTTAASLPEPASGAASAPAAPLRHADAADTARAELPRAEGNAPAAPIGAPAVHHETEQFETTDRPASAHAERSEPSTPAGRRRPFDADGPAITARRAASPAPSAVAAPLAVEPPAIHVTIGRIELRAETTAAERRPAPTKSSPVTDLDTYLSSRRGGGR